jgi:hypothetical protein
MIRKFDWEQIRMGERLEIKFIHKTLGRYSFVFQVSFSAPLVSIEAGSLTMLR